MEPDENISRLDQIIRRERGDKGTGEDRTRGPNTAVTVSRHMVAVGTDDYGRTIREPRYEVMEACRGGGSPMSVLRRRN